MLHKNCIKKVNKLSFNALYDRLNYIFLNTFLYIIMLCINIDQQAYVEYIKFSK